LASLIGTVLTLVSMIIRLTKIAELFVQHWVSALERVTAGILTALFRIKLRMVVIIVVKYVEL
jgi:hypothetical protein